MRLGPGKIADTFDGRWITRGWSFQEERLACRLLVIRQNKFLLRCKSMERAEDKNHIELGEYSECLAQGSRSGGNPSVANKCVGRKVSR